MNDQIKGHNSSGVNPIIIETNKTDITTIIMEPNSSGVNTITREPNSPGVPQSQFYQTDLVLPQS